MQATVFIVLTWFSPAHRLGEERCDPMARTAWRLAALHLSWNTTTAPPHCALPDTPRYAPWGPSDCRFSVERYPGTGSSRPCRWIPCDAHVRAGERRAVHGLGGGGWDRSSVWLSGRPVLPRILSALEHLSSSTGGLLRDRTRFGIPRPRDRPDGVRMQGVTPVLRAPRAGVGSEQPGRSRGTTQGSCMTRDGRGPHTGPFRTGTGRTP